jgi:hypothetical protein
VDSYDPRQTEGVKERMEELLGQWELLKHEKERIIEEDLGRFNELYNEEKIPALIIKS